MLRQQPKTYILEYIQIVLYVQATSQWTDYVC